MSSMGQGAGACDGGGRGGEGGARDRGAGGDGATRLAGSGPLRVVPETLPRVRSGWRPAARDGGCASSRWPSW